MARVRRIYTDIVGVGHAWVHSLVPVLIVNFADTSLAAGAGKTVLAYVVLIIFHPFPLLPSLIQAPSQLMPSRPMHSP
jgi:hypothetical protein